MNQPTHDSPTISHREAWELLPWYVNGALEAPEVGRVEAHLESCSRCRSEVSMQDRLAHGIRNSEELLFSADRAFQRLDERIDEIERQAAIDKQQERVRESRPRWWASFLGAGRPVRLALAAQTLAIALLAVLAFQSIAGFQNGAGEDRANFRTLSTTATEANAAGPALRVVFDADTTESDLRALLLAVEGTLVGGPSPFGVYTIAVPAPAEPATMESAIEALRRSPLVTFVEPATRAGAG